MEPESRSIQTVYLVLTLCTTLAGSFIWGINTLFLLDAGLDNTQAFTVNAFFTVGEVLFEVPTGVVADTRGRRRWCRRRVGSAGVGRAAGEGHGGECDGDDDPGWSHGGSPRSSTTRYGSRNQRGPGRSRPDDGRASRPARNGAEVVAIVKRCKLSGGRS